MSKLQRAFFVVGLLALIALLFGSAGILLHRAFPDCHLITLDGPPGASAAVIVLRKMLVG